MCVFFFLRGVSQKNTPTLVAEGSHPNQSVKPPVGVKTMIGWGGWREALSSGPIATNTGSDGNKSEVNPPPQDTPTHPPRSQIGAQDSESHRLRSESLRPVMLTLTLFAGADESADVSHQGTKE